MAEFDYIYVFKKVVVEKTSIIYIYICFFFVFFNIILIIVVKIIKFYEERHEID